MSFVFNWEQLDAKTRSSLHQWLQDQIDDIFTHNDVSEDTEDDDASPDPMANAIGRLEIKAIDFGQVPPDLRLVDIGEPDAIFRTSAFDYTDIDSIYATSDLEHEFILGQKVQAGGSTGTRSINDDDDDHLNLRSRHKNLNTQFVFELDYAGDASVVVETELRIHYPTPNFMAMPIKLTLSNFRFLKGAQVIVAYVDQYVCISIRRPEAPAPTSLLGSDSVASSSVPSIHVSDYELSKSSLNSINTSVSSTTPITPAILEPVAPPLLDIQMDSEIGDANIKQPLKNVAKLSRFIMTMLNKTLDDQLVYPEYKYFWIGELDDWINGSFRYGEHTYATDFEHEVD